jgi:hypothetical protein
VNVLNVGLIVGGTDFKFERFFYGCPVLLLLYFLFVFTRCARGTTAARTVDKLWISLLVHATAG